MKNPYQHIAELSSTIRNLEKIKRSKNLNAKQKEELLFNDLNNILLDMYTAWADNFIISLSEEYPDLTILKDRRVYPDKRIFFTFPLNKIKNKPGKTLKKKDIPAVCVGLNASDIIDGKANILVIIENDKETLTLPLQGLDELQTKAIIECLAKFMSDPGHHVYADLPRILSNLLKTIVEVKGAFKRTPLPKFSPYDEKSPLNKTNPQSLAQLAETLHGIQNKAVTHREEHLKIPLGGEYVEFLRSGDMYFVTNNTPTIRIIDLAVREGVLLEKDKKNFISIEKELEAIEETKSRYKKFGAKKGEGKDYRKNNFWRNAKAHYEYDPERGLYYLEIGDEPVMDEFEKEFITLLGRNSARYGGIVLEIGFGMGISANAIQQELARHAKSSSCAHIIIEYNKDVIRLARKWAKRQKIPVAILEGDWKEKIKELPDGILTGALADPYPLDVNEKHEDAARTLKEIYRCLRPGGITTYYSDSQYALSKRHAQLAKDAGFQYIGNLTSSFGKQLNTGEYYKQGLRMSIPLLYKAASDKEVSKKFAEVTAEEKKEIIQRIFIENPARFMDYYSLDL